MNRRHIPSNSRCITRHKTASNTVLKGRVVTRGLFCSLCDGSRRNRLNSATIQFEMISGLVKHIQSEVHANW